MEASLKISLLGPAHVADRIIAAAPFITRVVAAGPVGPGEADLKFLLVKEFPWQLDFCNPNVHQPSPIPQGLGCLFDRRVAFAGRADDSFVHAKTVRPGADS